MCPWGKCPGGTCPGGFCPVTGTVISSSVGILSISPASASIPAPGCGSQDAVRVLVVHTVRPLPSDSPTPNMGVDP